jgi:hypothetical protein
LSKNRQALESAKRRGDNSKIFKIEQAIADQKYFVERLEGVTRSLRKDLGYGPKIQSDFTTTTPIENQDIDSVLDDFQRR